MTADQNLINYLCNVIVEATTLMMGEDLGYRGFVTPEAVWVRGDGERKPVRFKFKFDFSGNHSEGDLFSLDVHSNFCAVSMWNKTTHRWNVEAQVLTPDRKTRPNFQDVNAEDILHTLRDWQTKAFLES